MKSWGADLRLALRRLGKTPVFAVSAIVTLALGVGANTGAFSALNTLLLKKLPYPAPERLVALYETTVDGKPRGVAEANLLDWRTRTTAFESMAVYQPRTFGLTRDPRDVVTVVQTGMVMADFFRALSVTPALGRTFSEGEETSGARLLVLSDRLWREMFAADPGVIGRELALNEEPYTVIGVMPPGFEYPMGQARPDAYIPLSRRDYCCGRLGQLDAVGRLRAGVTLDRARTELQAAAHSLEAEYPATNAGRTAGLEPLDRHLKLARRDPLLLLSAAAVLLLLIASANVAGLVLARCLARSHEIAVRISLGATARRLASQFLAESLLLSAVGAVCGLAAADAVLRLAAVLVPGAAQTPLHIDRAALAFAAGLALAVTVLLAGVPALLTRRTDLSGLIKAGGRQATSRSRLRGMLVVAQIAFSAMLLLSAGLLLRSFLAVAATSPGFEAAHALKFGIGLPEKRYNGEQQLIDFHQRLLDHLAKISSVTSAAAALRLPLRGGTPGPGGSFQIFGAGIPIPQRPRAWTNAVSPGYFKVMEIPILEGREFSWLDDRPGGHRVAIVNQAFQRAYLRGRNTVGTVLDIRWVSDLNPLGVPWEIVGVTADTRQANLDHDPIPEIFLSMTQVGSEGAVYVIRSRGGDAALPRAIASTVARLDPRLERVRVEPLAQIVSRNLEPRRAAVELVAGFGGLALLMAGVGIYGIIAYRAAERSREMAIRMALGASRTHVRGLVLGHAVRIATAGAALGLVGFLLVLPILKSQLYGVQAMDPVTVGVSLVVILSVAAAAAAAPARRAGRTAPGELLRDA